MDFETMVRRGLGRAVIYAREHDVFMYRDFLLHACLHNLAYDKQVEDDRSNLMTDVILATGDAESYTHELLKALATPHDDDYDAQVYEILLRISKPGDAAVRSTLYNCIAHDMANEDNYPAQILVEFDGLSGFLFALEQLEGREIDPDDGWRIGWLYEALEKKIGKPEAQAALDAAIGEHSTYARYAEMIRVKREQPKWVQPPVMVPSYEQITQSIANGKQQRPPITIARWGKEADEATVLKIASELLTETDHIRLGYYVTFFAKRPFPLSPDKLLALAESENEHLVWLARRALSQVAHPAVRELALRILRQPGHPVKAIALLASNFQDGDWDVVFKAVLRELSDDEYHRIEMDVRDLFEAHPLPEAKDTLLAVYERGPCLICRRAIVEDLQTLGALPEWMIEECRYDAEERTRELARNIRGD